MGNSVENNVFDELQKLKERYKEIRKNTYCRRTEMDDCDSCRADHYLDARIGAVDRSIEIVKQGCVSDDVCEWKKQNKTYDWKPSCEPNSTYNVAGVGWFKYCPYCGKKIKVVDK